MVEWERKLTLQQNIFPRNEIRQQEGSGHREQHRGGVQQADGGAGGQEEAGHGIPRQEVRGCIGCVRSSRNANVRPVQFCLYTSLFSSLYQNS